MKNTERASRKRKAEARGVKTDSNHISEFATAAAAAAGRMACHPRKKKQKHFFKVSLRLLNPRPFTLHLRRAKHNEFSTNRKSRECRQ